MKGEKNKLQKDGDSGKGNDKAEKKVKGEKTRETTERWRQREKKWIKKRMKRVQDERDITERWRKQR